MLQIECMNRSLKVVSIPALVEQAGKNTLENCLMTILLALAMVSSEETVRETLYTQLTQQNVISLKV